jgi:hypothetical protein
MELILKADQTSTKRIRDAQERTEELISNEIIRKAIENDLNDSCKKITVAKEDQNLYWTQRIVDMFDGTLVE